MLFVFKLLMNLNFALSRPDSQSEWEIAERGLSPERLYWRVVGKPWTNVLEQPTDNWEHVEFRVRASNNEVILARNNF